MTLTGLAGRLFSRRFALAVSTAMVALLAGGGLAGCGSSAPVGTTTVRAGDGATASAEWIAEALREETYRWEGTPYRLGGTTQRGIDCSAFTQRLFADALGVDLTRSTRSQVREGQRIARSDLRAGDLVFFRPGGKGRHVGVYVGDGEFAHASTNAGPTISPLSREYWEDTYWTSRRVLQVSAANSTSRSSTAEASAGPAVGKSSGERTGW